MATPASVLQLLVVANTKQANTALGGVSARMRGLQTTSTKSGAVASKALLGVGAAAVGTAAALFKVGEAFDKSYDKIRTQTGATGKDLKRLESDFNTVVKRVPVDFDTASTAVAGLSQRLGETGKPLRRLSVQVLQLSKVTGTDIQENVEAVTRLFGDWSIATKDQAKTLDGLFRVSQKTGATVTDLSRNLVQFGAPLRNLGVDFDFAAAMFGAFEKTGVNMTTVLSGLRLSVGNLAAPTSDFAATLKQLNIDAADTPQALADIFTNIKTLDDQASKALAIQAFGRRAGSDLRDTILGGKFALDDLIKTFDSGDETISKAERSTRDFSEQWQIFTNRLAVMVQPAATKFFKAIGEGMKMLNKLDLHELIASLQEFWDKAGALRFAVKVAWDAIVDIFGGAAREIKGFVEIISGILTGDFGRAWQGVKDVFSGAIKVVLGILKAATAPFRLAISALGKVLKGPFVAIWNAIKSVFAKGADFILGVFTTIIDGIAKVADAGSHLPGPIGDAWDKVQAFAEDTSDSINQMRERMRGDTEAMGKHAQKMAGQYEDAGGRVGKAVAQMAAKTGKSGQEMDTALDKVGKSADKNTGQAGSAFDRFGNKSAQLQVKVSSNFGTLQTAIGAGLQAIVGNTNKALKAFGVKQVKFALDTAVAAGAQAAGGHQRGGVITAASGTMVPGYGTGDKVPAMLEPGEVVLNRKAVAAMGGANKANSINAAIPRFQKGGEAKKGGADKSAMRAMVARANAWDAANEPYLWGGGHGAFQSNAGFPVDCSGAVSDVLHAAGLLEGAPMVSGALATSWGQPGTGPLTVYANPTHTFMSLDGKLFGTSPSNVNGGAGWIESGYDAGYLATFTKKTMDVAGGVVAGVAEKIKRQVLKGPDGPLKDMGQAALDKVRGAANAYLTKHAPAGTTGGGDAEIISGTGGSVVKTIGSILMKAGQGRTGAAGIIGNAYGESSWNPAAMEPGTDNGGLWGFTASPVSLADVRNYASAQKMPWDSAALQTNFLLQHYAPDHVSGIGTGAGSSWAKSLDAAGVAGATEMFMAQWERPASMSSLGTRQAAAQRALGMFDRGGIVQKLGKGGIVVEKLTGPGAHPKQHRLTMPELQALARPGVLNHLSDDQEADLTDMLFNVGWNAKDPLGKKGMRPRVALADKLFDVIMKKYGKKIRGGMGWLGTHMAEGGVVAGGDSLMVGMDKIGFPGAWDVSAVGGARSDAISKSILGKLEGGEKAVAFEGGTNDSNNASVVRRAIESVKKKTKAPLVVQTVSNGEAINAMLRNVGADGIADWAKIAPDFLSGDVHPNAEGYKAMHDLLKAAVNKVKGKGGGTDTENGGKGDEEEPDKPASTNVGTLDATSAEAMQSALQFSPKVQKLMKLLKTARDGLPLLQAKFDDRQIEDSFESSPLGSELSPGERSNEVIHALAIFNNISSQIDLVKRLLDMLPGRGDHEKTKLGGILWGWLRGDDSLLGLSGHGGALQAARQTLDTLQHPETPDLVADDLRDERIALLEKLLTEANLRTRVSQAQYGVLGAFASGGKIARTGAYLVGERGPEIVGLQQGGQVYSNTETQQMLSPTVVINGDIINTPPGKQPVEVLDPNGKAFAAAVRAVRPRGGNRNLPGSRSLI